MKFKLLILLLSLPVYTFSSDYYYYQGKRIELQAREDKIAIILNNNYSENFVRSKLNMLLGSGVELKKALPEVYTINFSGAKGPGEIDNFLIILEGQKELIKIATKVYYGSSKSVIQIPTDHFMVRLKNKNDLEKFNTLNIKNNCTVIRNVSNEITFLIRSNTGDSRNGLELSEAYYSSGMFEYSEPDFLYPERCLLHSIPNDIFFSQQWSLNNTGQLLQTGSWSFFQGDQATVTGIPGSDMSVAKAWDHTTGSPSIKVGIMDTGIDSLHPDLQAPGHLMCGYDAFNNVNSSAVDDGYHGTSIAGLVGAVMNNLIGVSGVAPGCRLMSIAVFDLNGNTSGSVIARAFDSARVKGIDVLNNSWGGVTPEATITNAINDAAYNGRDGLGCIIFFSSGNDGRNPPVYPSILPNVLCVGSSTPHDQKKAPGSGNQFFWGSNYGEDSNGDLDLTAPTNCYTLMAGGLYEPNFYGTSASAPNAAGVAALVLSVDPSQTRLKVFENIIRGCDKIDNVQYSINKPFGKWNHYYGYGRVNALNSVMLAAGVDNVPPSISHVNVNSHSSTYPTLIKADITDHDGSSVPVSGNNAPKIFYRKNKNNTYWTSYDSLNASSVTGSQFTFKIPSQGWETEVQYYIKAADNSGNVTTFPKHAPDPFWLCYFSVSNTTTDVRKIPSFAGADFGATISPPVNFGSFSILNSKFIIYMRHTYLNDEIIQVFSPITDANNNRKCLFASNGNDMDNITGAAVSDSASAFWMSDDPPYLNGLYKPEFNLRGFNGQNANGNWRILHLDRGIGDYAFFDSVKIILTKSTGVTCPSISFDNTNDSVVYFDSVSFPNTYEKNFYLKNSGTTGLSISGYYISGPFSSMYSVTNTPPSAIAPDDSGLFSVKLDTRAAFIAGDAGDSITGAILNIQNNDPSKNLFKVSLQTNEPLEFGLKNLQLTSLIEGLYNDADGSLVPDSVTVIMRHSVPPYSVVESAQGILDSDGKGSFNFSDVQNGTGYFIVIKHRNALETWSATGQSFNTSSMTYDFTTSLSKAFGSNMILKGTKYCLFSGDVDHNGNINLDDILLVSNMSKLFSTGHLSEDLNGDSIINLTDILLTCNNSSKFISLIRP
ncbi:MAG: S8 family serine peptidase [Ignavibacteria bacterium]